MTRVKWKDRKGNQSTLHLILKSEKKIHYNNDIQGHKATRQNEYEEIEV